MRCRRPFPSGSCPLGLAFTPDGKHAYVANYVDGTVSVIDTAIGTVSAVIGVRQGALGVAATPDGKHIYVSNQNDGTVSVLTTASGTVPDRSRRAQAVGDRNCS